MDKQPSQADSAHENHSNLEERRFKEEIRIKDEELRLKAEELQIEREQFESAQLHINRGRFVLFDKEIPGLAVTILVAVITVIGATISSFVSGVQNRSLEREKFNFQKDIEQQKFESELVITAIKTGDPQAASRNLAFLLKAGLLNDAQGKIKSATQNEQDIPVLPAPDASVTFKENSSLVCHLNSIAGFEGLAEKALAYVGTSTASIDEMKVFVAVEKDMLYLHSNYLTPGAKYPTKIATNEKNLDLATLAYNLVGATDFGSLENFKKMMPKIRFYVNENVYAYPQFSKMFQDGHGNIQVIRQPGEE